MDDKDIKQAKAVYATLCEMLDECNWSYRKKEEALAIEAEVSADDLDIKVVMQVDAERQLVSIMSLLPFTVRENRRTAIAVAVSVTNARLANGSFDYDYENGKIAFRMMSSCRGSLIGKGLLKYMLMCACSTVANYDDKFFMVSVSEMQTDEIIDYLN